jgi:surface antigen
MPGIAASPSASPPRHRAQPAVGRVRLLRALLAAGAVVAATLVTAAGPAAASSAYRVTLVGPDHQPLANEAFVLSGTVTPAAPGDQVALQLLRGHTFRTVAKTKLDRSSSYQFAQVFSTVGGRVFRVTKAKDHTADAGVSRSVRVFVTGYTVHAGVVLTAGDGLASTRGSYRLAMLTTGDLVITIGTTGRTIWSFGTGGHPGATAVLEHDGDLVVHDAHGKVLKRSGSGGHRHGSYSLVLREDSNLDVYSPGGAVLWSSETTNDELRAKEQLRAMQFLWSSDRRFELLMRKDGDLAIYDTRDGSIRWDTGTSEPNSRVVMGPGGALTVYGPKGRELWSSRTSGLPGAYAILQKDGNLVIYQKGVARWASDGIGGVLGDDYPDYLRRAERDSIIDPWRFYNRECTSFVAWRMNSANGVDFNNFMGGGRFGSAYHWDDNARSLGYTVDQIPARGAIAESDREGHVAWVASVGDGVVTIEDYNYSAPGEYDVRTVPTSTYIYIHIKDL